MKTILGNAVGEARPRFSLKGASNRAHYAMGRPFCVYVHPGKRKGLSYGPAHYVGVPREALPAPNVGATNAIYRIRVIPKNGRPTIYEISQNLPPTPPEKSPGGWYYRRNAK